ncbi:MAG: hypothetical protein Q8O51_00145 [bacterium]|nr:hypothetical protein [bacterium]
MLFRKKRNTLDKGSVRYVIFNEDGTWYGVALEFNIVVEGDDQASIYLNLVDAVRGYLAAARSRKIRPTVLNQTVSPEYLQLWSDLESGKKMPTLRKYSEKEDQEETPVQVATYGFFPQPA